MNRLLLVLYRLLAVLLTPVLLLLLCGRLLQGKEDPQRITERLGLSRRSRPAGALVWLHAASVGELISLVPLLQALADGPVLLVTTVTRSSADLAKRLLPEGVIHQFVPMDHWLAFAFFRRHWRPSLGVLAEAELWPELIHAMPRPWLINARMSEGSFQRHRRQGWFAAWVLGRLQLCLAQSAQDAERYRRLGVRHVQAVGSTKRDAAPPPVDAAIVQRIQRLWPGRSVLLLASSHPGEEALLLQAYPLLKQHLPDLALLLVPRHPQRAPEVAALAARTGLQAQCWSDLEEGPRPLALDALVADRFGAMGAWIAASRLVVMGGSLAPAGAAVGGHNPLEPVRLARPVLCGPDMANFAELTEELAAGGWLQQWADADALWRAVIDHPIWRAVPVAAPPPLLQGPSAAIAERIRAELAR